jgi:hypothetical protein
MSRTRTIRNYEASADGQTAFYSSAAPEASKVVKASTGTLAGFNVVNVSAATKFVQLHNATALPADGAVPTFQVQVAANSQMFVTLDAFNGIYCSTGIVLCASTTAATKTIATADLLLTVFYV